MVNQYVKITEDVYDVDMDTQNLSFAWDWKYTVYSELEDHLPGKNISYCYFEGILSSNYTEFTGSGLSATWFPHLCRPLTTLTPFHSFNS